MDLALITSALLMGIAGSPHCVAMCGASCSALSAGPVRHKALVTLQLGRLLSYAAGGALAAASVGSLARLGESFALLRPFWVLIHLAALGLGFYLIWQGRQPRWLEAVGQGSMRMQVLQADALATSGVAMARRQIGRAGLAGLAWVAWPCGLLQSALVLAAVSSGPAQGALIMAAFATTSALGLWLGPLLLLRLLGQARDPQRGMRWSVRLAGVGLAAASVFALGHGVWRQLALLCGIPV
ncbi:sulfite exporter TauE/SafE family protein [Chitinimonas sp. BJYL2]|uniref:sulfite exporter TauE/SafE family protein n=1 Tax=Chitinimonas sp. BJYL2 TaxID=2976696 RepID=UPI0022B2CFB3|nr:sulfite exporter TauE/SafE family protein [Chitinimonas sp. BJYL2]